MYIYPNSTLYILHNVNLNKDYDHTIYFARADYQQAFFLDSSKIKYQLDNQSYMRMERGWLKVNKNQNDLWDCTYIVFRNTSYGTKYFYAFINSVEYINDNTSKINFEIDEIQTWWFDYSLEKCFVEREHTLTDNLFGNIINEDLDVGDYYNAQIVNNYYFNARTLAILQTADSMNIASDPSVYKNMFSGLFIAPYSLSSSYLSDYVKDFISRGHEDNIIAMFLYPNFIGNPNVSYDSTLRNGGGYGDEDFTFTTPNFVNVDGYVPKNKKLFCYPYNFLNISDKEGNSKDLKWELWDSSYIGQFLIEGSIIGKPTVSVTPKHYREISLDRDNSLTYDNFPYCAWSGDSYQVWLARNMPASSGIERAITGQSTGIPAIVGTVIKSGGYLASGRADKALNNLSDSIAGILSARNIPAHAHGEQKSNTINIQNGSSGFQFIQMTIKSEYAKIIDEYFSRFGYACRRIKVPNRYARTNWTYTKTVGCELTGNLPSDSADRIKKIYDHGITFWANGNNIGNYGDFTNAVLSH